MSSRVMQRSTSSVGSAACAARLRRLPCTLRHFSWLNSVLGGQTRSAHSSSPNWLGDRRATSSLVFSYRHCFQPSPFRTLRSASRIIKSDEDTVSEADVKDPLNATGASSGQADDRIDFKYKYFPMEDVEKMEFYCPGGYHPVAPGDTLNDGRYQVVNKLGYGRHAIVWIARDKSSCEFVALKICASDITARSQETQMMRKLLQSDDERTSMILPVLDDFVLHGPNGHHLCIVTTLARTSIAASKDASNYVFSLSTARAITAQLAQAVAFCHAQGVVHGDLHTGNILLRFAPDDNIHALSQEAFYKRFGYPRPTPVECVDGSGPPDPHPSSVPINGYAEGFLGGRSEELTLADSAIFLSDFAESYTPSATLAPHLTCYRAPLRRSPPEGRFATSELGFPADIWALACAIWEVVGVFMPLFGCVLFPGKDSLTQDWVYVLGRLPEEWWAAWDGEFRRGLFTDDGVARDDRQNHFLNCGPGLDGRFDLLVQEPRREEKMGEFSYEEKAALLKMLRPMLAYKPADRIDAEGVLSTEWMLRWGLPALNELKKLRKL